VHTRWIETEFDNTIEPFTGGAEAREPRERQTILVEVGGRRLEVSLPAESAAAGNPGRAKARKRSPGKAAAVSGDAVTAPMQGTIVKIAVADGQQVATGDLIAVLEVMKMENPVTAHKNGTVTGLTARPGDSVAQGTALCELTD
jgi:acetyl-CoA/propionyl-CoA carboxylase biotin carboxyl carrier protein